ncbi:hypothetical protein [Polaromonas sp. C04]|uniref:hypothetical protein n=1 Tax=Polaromonas sp. C04 TaxID=1945857 RepID=UPI000985C727|nr:hypothetical protein [Polaromonas sp. C04]OOG51182.1 hypothetical protein B0E49_16290 [Polaromonas sp. C04]
MKNPPIAPVGGFGNVTAIGAAGAPTVWTLAGILSHFVAARSLQRAGAQQLGRIQRPLAWLQEFRHGAFRAISLFPVSDSEQVLVGVQWTGEFSILSGHNLRGTDPLPDWNLLEASLMERARPLGSADQRLLRQHLDRQWARALQAAHGAPRIKALLARWQAHGIHLAMTQILAAHGAYADPHAVHLLRSVGSRSIAVYNWLCATKILRSTRCAALRLEPTFVAHAVCHRGACTDRLLEAIDLREPLRAVIRQGFGLGHGEIRYLNRVVGAREVSAERFAILIRHIAPLPPQARPTTFNGVLALAAAYDQRMLDSLSFLFPAGLCRALGPVTTRVHRQAVHRTWARFALQHQRLHPNGSTPPTPDDALDWLSTNEEDLEDEIDLVPLLQGWGEADEPDTGNEVDWRSSGPTSDELFEEWLLALPFEATRSIHLQLCRLSVARRAAYVRHWRCTLPESLQLCTAMLAVAPALVAGIAHTHGVGMGHGQTVQFITPSELDAWNDAAWRVSALTCADDFARAASELGNCVDDPAYFYRALALDALYIRLTATATGEETLIEFAMGEAATGKDSAGSAGAVGMGFTIAQHLGINNAEPSRASQAKAVQILGWLNRQFGATQRGTALAAAHREIQAALARHLTVHRSGLIRAAAARIHKQGLR